MLLFSRRGKKKKRAKWGGRKKSVGKTRIILDSGFLQIILIALTMPLPDAQDKTPVSGG